VAAPVSRIWNSRKTSWWPSIIKYKNVILFVTEKQRPEPEKPINQEHFLTELRDQLNEFHIESGRSILEGGELSNP